MKNSEFCLLVYIVDGCDNKLTQWDKTFSEMPSKTGYSRCYMSHTLQDLIRRGLVKFAYVRGKSYFQGDKYVRQYYATEKGLEALGKEKSAH